MEDYFDSILPEIIATSLAAGVVSWWLFQRRRADTTSNLPPMAKAGMLETIKAISGTDAPWFTLRTSRELQSKVFRLRIPIPGGMYMLGDPIAQRQVLLDKSSEKPAVLYRRFEIPGTEPGIFTRETADPLWKVVRKGTAVAFAKDEVDRMTSICCNVVDKWMKERLEPMVQAGDSFDPSEEMLFLTFSSIMRSAFEYLPSVKEFKVYTHNTDAVLREFGFKQSTNPLRRTFGFMIPEVRRALQCSKTLTEFTESILHAYRVNPNKSPHNTLIKLIEQLPIPDKLKRTEIGAYLFGGHDTTGFTLSTTLILLAKHPKVASKVHSSLATQNDPTKPSEYLRHVILESRRLLMVAPMGSIRCLDHDFRYNGYVIPAKSNIFLPQILAHRDPDVFGPDADEFRPERWWGRTQDMQDAVISFSLGARNCIGQSLATAELMSVLPKVLSNYRFELAQEGTLEYFFTLKFKGARLRAIKI